MLAKMLMSANPMLYDTVRGSPDRYLDAAFDSKLIVPPAPGQNYRLHIVLRVFYQQINPPEATAEMMRIVCRNLGVPISAATIPGWYSDANNTPQLIKNWTMLEWRNFTTSIMGQANKWDGQFWLVPPNEFSFFDVVDQRGVRTRPNVKCEFNLEIAPTIYGAHRKIDVVNLANHQFFRSHETLYDSDDLAPSGAFNQLTGTHEAGHALGLGHVAALRNRPNCGFAILLKKTNLPFDPIRYPRNTYAGGENSSVCYGDPSFPADANNVMGAGMDFAPEDAKPWLDRLPEHLNVSNQGRFEFGLNLSKWKVAMVNTPPRVIR